jgi:hypothetical protein
MLKCLSGNQEINIVDYQSEGQLLELRSLSNQGLLHCPDPLCGGTVILHKCNLKRSHFAHRNKGEQCRISEESIEHDLVKSWIYTILRNQYSSEFVKIEAFVDSGQKADILLITPTKKFAIEIQFSPQSDEVWAQRTSDYHKAGIIPLWIIGVRDELALVLKGENSFSSQRDFPTVRNLESFERNIVRNIYFRPTWEKAGVKLRQESAIAHLVSNRNQPATFHFVSVINKESTTQHHLHSAIVWKENNARKSGFLIDLDDEISFSESEERFISKAEADYSKIFTARKEKQAIENEKYLNELLRRKEQKGKFISHLMTKFQITSLEQFPEVKIQENALRQNKNLPRQFHVNKCIYPNEDYLLVELAIYIKFVKLSKPGSRFDMEEIKSYLIQWGLWDEARFQTINAWIARVLQQLVSAEVLSKSKVDRKPTWIILKTDITPFFTGPSKPPTPPNC